MSSARRNQHPPVRNGDQASASANGASVAANGNAHANPEAPRVLYIDGDDDLPALLDRLEEHGSPAIVVLPESARAVRGGVAARLLKRRADAAGIPIVVVCTDRSLGAALRAAGLTCVSTVGEARVALRGDHADPIDPLLDLDWDADDGEASGALTAVPVRDTSAPAGRHTVHDADAALSDMDEDEAEAEGDPAPATPIVVPRQTPTTQRRSPMQRVRRWLIGLGVAALLALIGVAVWIIFFPAATLRITYALGSIDRTFVVGLGTAPGDIPIHHTHLTDSAEVTVPGTGVEYVPDGHASGTIALANPLNGVVHVPAGTIVDAQNGSRFATLQAVDVPSASHSFSGTTNGQASVQVQALLGGTAGNVGQGSIVGIEGRLAGALLVTNIQPFSGGTMRTIYSVTPADVRAPEATLQRRLAGTESAALPARYARAVARVVGQPRLVSQTVTTIQIGGRPYARVRVTMRTDMSYVHHEDVTALATTRLRALLAGRNQRIVSGTETVDASLAGRGSGAKLRVRVRAVTSPSIDVANLRALLVGQSIPDARALLDGSARNGGWHYTLKVSPDLAGRMPQASGLITISVQHVGA